jgi:hypothetical protein
MIELLLPCGFDTLEYSWEKATIGICTLADYSVATKCQHRSPTDNVVASRMIIDQITPLLPKDIEEVNA